MSTINLTYHAGDGTSIVRDLLQIKEQHRLAPEVFFQQSRGQSYGRRNEATVKLTLGGEDEDTPLVLANVSFFPVSLYDPDPTRAWTRWEMDDDGLWHVRLPKAKAVKLLERLNAPEDLLQAVKGRVTIETFRSLSVEQTMRDDGTEVETVTTEARDTPSVAGKINTVIDGLDIEARLVVKAPHGSFESAIRSGYMAAKDIEFAFTLSFDQKPALAKLRTALGDAGFKTYDGCHEHDHSLTGRNKKDITMFLWREDAKLAEKIKAVTEAFGHPPFAFWDLSGSTVSVDFIHPNQDRTIHTSIELLPEKLVRLIEGNKTHADFYATGSRYRGTELSWSGTQSAVRSLLKMIGADEDLVRRFARTETITSETIKEWNNENPKKMRRKGCAIKQFSGEYGGCKLAGDVSIGVDDKGKMRFHVSAEYDVSPQIKPVLDKLRDCGFQVVEGHIQR